MTKENIDPTCDDIDLAKLVLSDCGCSTEHAALLDRVAIRIAKHAEKAVAYEREACAKVCESRIDREWPGDDLSMMAQGCADAIRERGME